MANNNLMSKLINSSTIKLTAALKDSTIFNKKEMVPTRVPMINVALSGSIDGGMAAGILTLAGPSKHFKTTFALLMAAAYLDKFKDAVLLFYDNEFGSPQSYFESNGIDLNRVVHTPFTTIEELRHDISNQLKNLERGDKVIIVIDSVGNAASQKEVNDAIEGNDKADMTRAKVMKSLFRIVTPHLTIKDIPLIVINHIYEEMGLYPKKIVSGGTGIYLSSDNIWILGRQQVKEQDEIAGYDFIINVEKSRFVKEKSRIPISVTYEKGINTYSGLFALALEEGYITSPSKGWFSPKFDETVKHRKGDIAEAKAFWDLMFEKTDFAEHIRQKYTLADVKPIGADLETGEVE